MTAAISTKSNSSILRTTNTFPLHAVKSSSVVGYQSSNFAERTTSPSKDEACTTELTEENSVSEASTTISLVNSTDIRQNNIDSNKMRGLSCLLTFESLVNSSSLCTAAAEPAPRPWLPCDSTTTKLLDHKSNTDEPFYCDNVTISSSSSSTSPRSMPILFSIGDGDDDDDDDLSSTWFYCSSLQPLTASALTTTAFASSQRLSGTFSAEAAKKLGKLARASIHKRCYSTPESAWTSSSTCDDMMEIDEADDDVDAAVGGRSRHSSLPTYSVQNSFVDSTDNTNNMTAPSHNLLHNNSRRFNRYHGHHRKLIETKRACPFDSRHVVHADQYEKHLHECQSKRFETYVRKRFRKVAVAKAERQASVVRMPSIAEEDHSNEHH